ncbi:MAG: hypothetical protein ACE5R6_08230 [Candidatus Heimdallarchaeota archaeon]
MARIRRIRRVLEPNIAKQEVTNISKLYRAMGWVVHVSSDTENGAIIHRIVANKGTAASIIIELEEADKDKKDDGKGVLENSITLIRPEPELEPATPLKLNSKQKPKVEASLPEISQVIVTKGKDKPPQLKGMRIEDLQAYVEQDETGIVPALVAEGAIVFENGVIKLKKWIQDREKFLYAREYFKKVGLKI